MLTLPRVTEGRSSHVFECLTPSLLLLQMVISCMVAHMAVLEERLLQVCMGLRGSSRVVVRFARIEVGFRCAPSSTGLNAAIRVD